MFAFNKYYGRQSISSFTDSSSISHFSTSSDNDNYHSNILNDKKLSLDSKEVKEGQNESTSSSPSLISRLVLPLHNKRWKRRNKKYGKVNQQHTLLSIQSTGMDTDEIDNFSVDLHYKNALSSYKLQLSKINGNRKLEADLNSFIACTIAVLGEYDDAIGWFIKYLRLTTEMQNKYDKSMAYYYLGLMYHYKAKFMLRNSFKLNNEIRSLLQVSLLYYGQNSDLAKELKDQIGEARAYGNIGNIYCLLENHSASINYFTKRLEIAKRCHDKEGERRAHGNLGNAYLKLNNFEKALIHYREAMDIDIVPFTETVYTGPIYSLKQDYDRSIYCHQFLCRMEETSFRNQRFQITKSDRLSMLVRMQSNVSNKINKQKDEQTSQPFLDQLMKCQKSRYEDQRAVLPPLRTDNDCFPNKKFISKTENNDDLFSLLERAQSRRINDQRSYLPSFDLK